MRTHRSIRVSENLRRHVRYIGKLNMWALRRVRMRGECDPFIDIRKPKRRRRRSTVSIWYYGVVPTRRPFHSHGFHGWPGKPFLAIRTSADHNRYKISDKTMIIWRAYLTFNRSGVRIIIHFIVFKTVFDQYTYLLVIRSIMIITIIYYTMYSW